MPPFSGVKVIRDNTATLVKRVMALTRREVLIGIPATEADRTDGPFNNAAIGYLNEFGSPSQNIPARPHLVPGVRKASDKILPHMKKAAEDAMALDEQKNTLDQHLGAAGQIAASSVQKTIIEVIPPPLKANTIYNRQHRKVAPRMGTTPLIDRSIYLQHITYVLRNKGAGLASFWNGEQSPGMQLSITETKAGSDSGD